MTELTCEKCNYHKTHQEDNHEYCSKIFLDIEHCKPCSFYVNKDGKRPRFCRLASSVDEMAEAFVESGYNKGGEDGWYFVGEPTKIYFDRDIPKAKAKAWLMEVEE